MGVFVLPMYDVVLLVCTMVARMMCVPTHDRYFTVITWIHNSGDSSSTCQSWEQYTLTHYCSIIIYLLNNIINVNVTECDVFWVDYE